MGKIYNIQQLRKEQDRRKETDLATGEKTAYGWLKDIAALWIPVVFLMMTFYMDDGYFNLLEAKAYVFQMASIVYVVAVLICLLLCKYYDEKLRIARWRALDGIMLAFMAVILASAITSKYPKEAFLGSFGWSVGGIFLVTCGVVYFLVSRCLHFKPWMESLIKVSGLVIFLWTCCDVFYFDIFELHYGIVDEMAYNYVASIGNVNWFAGYLSLMLPFYFYGLGHGKKWERILSGIGLFVGLFAGVNCNADSVFLGLGVLLLFSLLESIGNREKSLFAGIGWFIIGVSAGISDWLRQILPMVELEGITYAFVEQHLWIGVVVGGIVLLLFPNIPKRKYRIVLRVIVAVIAMVIVTGLGIWQLGQFDASWGTNRGSIWQAAMDGFLQGDLREKIIGIGPDCFGYAYEALTGSDWVRNAHNEYLQYLVTTGVAGILCYISIYIVGIWYGIQALRQQNRLGVILIVSILSYGAQAVVNNPQALNGAIFFTFLAILFQCDIMDVRASTGK